jgi:hypothetical protein
MRGDLPELAQTESSSAMRRAPSGDKQKLLPPDGKAGFKEELKPGLRHY